MKRRLKILALYLAVSAAMFVVVVGARETVHRILRHQWIDIRREDWVDDAMKALIYGGIPFAIAWLKERQRSS